MRKEGITEKATKALFIFYGDESIQTFDCPLIVLIRLVNLSSSSTGVHQEGVPQSSHPLYLALEERALLFLLHSR